MSNLFKTATILSPAKINLFLKITGKRKDGYHNIATLFQMIDLYDKITFSPSPKREIEITCSKEGIPPETNLVYLAAQALWKPGLPGVSIHIEKNIPVGAGLGGGSSNCATALFALNRLWKLGLPQKKLMAKGKKLGADVPFFLFGPRAWGTGTGDRLTPLPPAEPFHILLVKPSEGAPTAKIYETFSLGLTKPLSRTKIPFEFKGLVLFEDTVAYLINDLEKTVVMMHPAVGTIRKALTGEHCKGVMLSGSGTTVFGLFKDKPSADQALRKISRKQWWCRLAKPLTSMKHFKKGI